MENKINQNELHQKRIKILWSFIDFSKNTKKRNDALEEYWSPEITKKFNKAENTDRYISKGKLMIDKAINNIKWNHEAYIISEINDHNKKSLWYKNCNGICMVGKSIKTGKNISVLTHQCPTVLFKIEKEGVWLTKIGEKFRKDITRTIESFINETEEESRDYIIFWGNYFSRTYPSIENTKTWEHAYFYKQSVKLLIKIMQEVTWVYPEIITWPNKYTWGTWALFDNEKRVLYQLRYSGMYNGSNENTDIEDIDNYMKMLNKEISYQEYIQRKYTWNIKETLSKEEKNKWLQTEINKLLENDLFLDEKNEDNEKEFTKKAIIENIPWDDLSKSIINKININVYEHIRELYQTKKNLNNDLSI